MRPTPEQSAALVTVFLEACSWVFGYRCARRAEFQEELDSELNHYKEKSDRLRDDCEKMSEALQEARGKLQEVATAAKAIHEQNQELWAALEEAESWRDLPWWQRLFPDGFWPWRRREEEASEEAEP